MHCHLFRLRMLLAAVCLVPSIPVVAQDAAPPAPADVPMILRISAREVVLDVVARDKNHNSVNDLAESDFQAFETGKHADKNPHRILSLRVIDPRRDASHAGASDSGFRISSGAICALNATFCGDVYELSSGASQLPDFWNLEPVGSIYTDTLNVVEQDIVNVEGIPGVTRNNTWFGVDYYGEFFIAKPGDYLFELQSDDGSRLEIDNQPVIDLDGVHQADVKSAHIHLAAGRHTIHVPYFQGPPTSLALMLASSRPANRCGPSIWASSPRRRAG